MNPQLQSSETKNTVEYAGLSVALREMQERVLRVTEALYRTTDLFSDNEPLKWSLRESAVKILQAVSALDQSASFDDVRAAQHVEKNIRALLITIELAASSAFMARKNFEVFNREYIALRDMVTNTAIAGSRLLSLSSLSIGTELREITTQAAIEEKKASLPNTLQSDQKERKNGQNGPMSEMTKPMSERKDMILKFIQEKGSSGIKNVARSLEVGLSEKTIQRDLNTLVELGLLRKEGEKRWRRYFV